MPRGTTLRNVRIDDELWSAAKTKAAAEGSDVSTVLRELLGRWVTRPPRKR
jgi:hypothetical protein